MIITLRSASSSWQSRPIPCTSLVTARNTSHFYLLLCKCNKNTENCDTDDYATRASTSPQSWLILCLTTNACFSLFSTQHKRGKHRDTLLQTRCIATQPEQALHGHLYGYLPFFKKKHAPKIEIRKYNSNTLKKNDALLRNENDSVLPEKVHLGMLNIYINIVLKKKNGAVLRNDHDSLLPEQVYCSVLQRVAMCRSVL